MAAAAGAAEAAADGAAEMRLTADQSAADGASAPEA